MEAKRRSRKRAYRTLRWLLYPILGLVVAEGAYQLIHRLERGEWRLLTFPGDQIHMAFQRHPYLVGVPRAGIVREHGGIRISHDAEGHRFAGAPRPPRPGIMRIAAVGGSTTYGSYVSDAETWPALLERNLGPGFDVINLGVPGYSTMENLIQTAFWLSDLEPSLVLYLVGTNDLRNSHVANLEPDYSNFHAAYLHGALGLFNTRVGNRSALLFYGRRLAAEALTIDPPGKIRFRSNRKRGGDPIDERALALYVRNLRSIIALCRSQGIRPVFLQQPLNFDAFEASAPTSWAPTIPGREMRVVMESYNAALVETVQAEGAEIVAGVLDVDFGAEDFVDGTHFSKRGNAKFAKRVARGLRRLLAAGDRADSAGASPGT